MKSLSSKSQGRVQEKLTKLTSFVLTFLMVFASLGSSFVYAQTTSEDSSLPTTGSDTAPVTQSGSTTDTGSTPVLNPLPGDTTSTTSESPTTPTDNTQSPTTPTSPTVSPTPTTPPSGLSSISPTLTGNVSDVLNPQYQLTPDQTNGSFNYEYPIKVPPGRNSMTPDIRLEYNNQVGEDISPYGFGWTDNIPYIRRINKIGVNNLYTLATSTTASTTYFYSSMSGELASTSATSYISRVDNGEYLKYTYTNNSWTVVDKNGTTYTFGTSTNDQIASSTDTTKVYQWNLEQVKDTNGNYIQYSYYKDGGQIYPLKVTYTNDATSTGIYEIDFSRQSRTDVATSSKASFDIVDNYLISEIDVKTNGTIYHKYVLAYTTGNNGRRSLLKSITETGYDESLNATTLPATTFTYSTTTPGWTENATWHSPVTFVEDSNSNGLPDIGVRIADINGDGLPDIIQSLYDGTNHTQHSYINTGNGYADNSTWYLPADITFKNGSAWIDGSVELVDINGDGLTDVVYSWDADNGSKVRHTYINNGHGFTEDTGWNLPIALAYQDLGGNLYDNAVQIADVNGDGLPDVIQALNAQDGTCVRHSYINNGHGFYEDHTWDIPCPTPFYYYDNGINYYPQGTVFTDINGDGLPDIIHSYENTNGTQFYAAYVNNGHGFTRDDAWDPPVLFMNLNVNPPGDYGSRMMDVNGDGLPDIVQAYSVWGSGDAYHAYLNTGHGWTTDQSQWYLPRTFTMLSGSVVADRGLRITDINGSGVSDLIQRYQNDGNHGFDYSLAYTSSSTQPDLLTTVGLSKGGTTTVAYQGTPMYAASGTTTPLSPNLPLVLQTVKTITTNDGEGNIGTTTYSYSGGVYFFNNPYDRKFGGFQTVTMTDPSGNVTKSYFHTGTGTDSTHGEYQDNEYKIGKPYRVEKYDNNNNLYEKTINKWDTYSRQSNADFVMLDQTVDETYDGTTNHKDKAESYTYDNTTGNMTQKVEYGQVTGNDDGTFTDTGTDKFTTNISYASSGGSNVTGLPSDETKVDQSSVTVAETRHYYDGLALGSVGAGNETKTEKLKSGSTYINTQKTYNSYGNVTQEKDPLGNPTNYTMDTYHMYPATSTNALSQATGHIYNYTIGKEKQTNDPNGLITQTIYDGFGRKEQENEPDLTTPSTLDTKSVYSYVDTGIPTSVHETDYMTPSLTFDTYSYYDGFNRIIQDKKTTNTANTYIAKDRTYNTRGLLASETLPYFSTNASNTAATTTSALFINYTYDALQRLGTTTNAVGTTTNVYNNWKLTITDPRGKTKDLYSDAYNNLIQVDEHNSGSTYSTYYTYDGLNDLTKITDALSNVRNFTYDNLGRRTKAEDLHASADTTFGSTTYAYDDASNLTQQIDAKNQTVNYTYDALNRPLTQDFTGSAGTEMLYGYDSCTLGIGKLCSATTTDATSTLTYNSLGGIASEKKDVGAKSFTTSYTYDQLGNINVITYPDNSKVEYNYGTGAQPSSIYQAEAGHLYHILVSNITYSPLNQVTLLNYVSNELVQTNTYDQNHLYRLTSMITTSTSTKQYQNLAFTYDADGNITQTVDNSNTDTKKTMAYTYDDLNRLTQASSTGAVAGGNYLQTYSYDALGNFSNKSDIGNYTYAGNTGSSYADPDAATTIGSVTYNYDNNGNLASTSAGVTNTWNYRNQLTQTVASTTINYGYDYNGDRVKYSNASSTTYFANKYYDIGTSTATTEKHIYLNNNLIGLISNTGANASTQPEAVDNLGSMNVVLSNQGLLQELVDYYPYGSLRLDEKTGTPVQELKKFTGKNYDTDTGFNYFGARYESPTIGKFISEDPVFLDVGDNARLNQDIANPNSSLVPKINNTNLNFDLTQSNKKDQQKSQSINQVLMKYLQDPQRLNSYMYAGDNPLKNTDPTGKSYYDFGININATPWSGTIGIRIDPSNPRVDAYVGSGPSYGASGSITGLYNVGDLPQSNNYTQAAVTGIGGFSGVVGEVDQTASYSLPKNTQPAGFKPGAGIGVGVGASYSSTMTYGTTIYNYSSGYNIVNAVKNVVNNVTNTVLNIFRKNN